MIHRSLDTTQGLRLTLANNGRKFGFEQDEGFDSYGLANMKHRADEINAIFMIEPKARNNC